MVGQERKLLLRSWKQSGSTHLHGIGLLYLRNRLRAPHRAAAAGRPPLAGRPSARTEEMGGGGIKSIQVSKQERNGMHEWLKQPGERVLMVELICSRRSKQSPG